VFWWCAGIFAAGTVICGALLRRGPLTPPSDIPTREPVGAEASAEVMRPVRTRDRRGTPDR
jgi:hypothetical protein